MYGEIWYLIEGENDRLLNKQYKNNCLCMWKKGKIRIMFIMFNYILDGLKI